MDKLIQVGIQTHQGSDRQSTREAFEALMLEFPNLTHQYHGCNSLCHGWTVSGQYGNDIFQLGVQCAKMKLI